MVARLRALSVRAFPHGWLDAVRQIVLFAAVYYAYRLVRGVVDGQTAVSFENARSIISVERSMHLFFEPAVNAWSQATPVVTAATSWLYINAHFLLTVGVLLWLYFFRNRSFYFVRNMFVVSMLVALVGYTVFPTAPPRLFPEWGFQDSVSNFLGYSTDTASVSVLFNPFAAVPSMHVCFALIVGLSVARLVRPRALKIAWACYPLLMTFVVVATANHWWADAVLGAATAAFAVMVAQTLLARARPEVWAFAGARATI
jgi:hypothetical protein